MKNKPLLQSLLATSILAACTGTAYAADIRINGFTSIVGGMTVKEGDTFTDIAVDPVTGLAVYGPSKSTFTADEVSSGTYDDDFSMKPDSIYGLQFTADLGHKLKVIGQLTGNGGEDFDTEVSWAYVSYDLTPEVNLQAGRQRLPLFLYSDYLDVGYAYHWIRVPTVLSAGAVDTFEGAKLSWTPSVGDWSYRTELFAGAGDEYVESIRSDVNFDTIVGATAKASNDWLQLRASYMQTDTFVEGEYAGVLLNEDGDPTTKDDPNQYTFWGLAAQANIGNGFVVAEYTHAETDTIVGYMFDAQGFYEDNSWYISAGHRFGDFTPHITYAQAVEDREVESLAGDNFEVASSEWTVGVRWDFHPSAALKLDYTMRSDDSDSVYKNVVRPLSTGGMGDSLEADVVALGVDVIF